MRHVLTYLIGLVFGLGISMSGMSNPAKVINFFDVAGTWDPSLAFVMGGAVFVAFLGYRFVLRRDRPVYEPAFDIPTRRDLDARLIGGSAVFGIGWGIAGFCPGGALPALGTLDMRVFLFTAALLAGIYAARLVMRITAGKLTKQAA
jgi:uncharacterized membrane protein YedE/YeeE